MRVTPDAIAFNGEGLVEISLAHVLESVERIYLSVQGTRSHPPIQGPRSWANSSKLTSRSRSNRRAVPAGPLHHISLFFQGSLRWA